LEACWYEISRQDNSFDYKNSGSSFLKCRVNQFFFVDRTVIVVIKSKSKQTLGSNLVDPQKQYKYFWKQNLSSFETNVDRNEYLPIRKEYYVVWKQLFGLVKHLFLCWKTILMCEKHVSREAIYSL
jgi:hypothetical protein